MRIVEGVVITRISPNPRVDQIMITLEGGGEVVFDNTFFRLSEGETVFLLVHGFLWWKKYELLPWRKM